jgi:hypothetical protein
VKYFIKMFVGSGVIAFALQLLHLPLGFYLIACGIGGFAYGYFGSAIGWFDDSR